jgi:DNA-binding NtrC family response regulator
MGTARKKISEAALDMLQKKNWPGNIRQFRNVVERLIILGDKEISVDDVKKFA